MFRMMLALCAWVLQTANDPTWSVEGYRLCVKGPCSPEIADMRIAVERQCQQIRAGRLEEYLERHPTLRKASVQEGFFFGESEILSPGWCRGLVVDTDSLQEYASTGFMGVGSPVERIRRLRQEASELWETLRHIHGVMDSVQSADSSGCPGHLRRVKTRMKEFERVRVELQQEAVESILPAVHDAMVLWIERLLQENCLYWPCGTCGISQTNPPCTQPDPLPKGSLSSSPDERLNWLGFQRVKLQQVEGILFRELVLETLRELPCTTDRTRESIGQVGNWIRQKAAEGACDSFGIRVDEGLISLAIIPEKACLDELLHVFQEEMREVPNEAP